MTVIIPSSYPVKGIFYMLTHPQLFSNLICPILITMIWGIAALIFGFAYLLRLQAHALINVKCPAAVAWIVCVIFVLLEVAVMIILFYLIILPIYQDGLFDRVLKLRGLRHVLKQNEGNDVVKCLRGVHGGLLIVFFQATPEPQAPTRQHTSPQSHHNASRTCIIVLILTLPLNLIPIAGQILYAMINGWILTFGLRFHYDAEIRNISVLQSRKEAWERRGEFTNFGSVAVGLEMIPLANLLFVWTNIVGSALWVADEIEKEEARLQQEQSSSSLIPQQPYRDSLPGSTPYPVSPSNGQFNNNLTTQSTNQYTMNYHNAPGQQYAPNPYSNQGAAMVPPKDKRHPQ
ncbi:hypothetical protein BGZ59_010689 [Podila verticillata]|nr:hypothetical protein BGZ59_010689 [Podila verticillata]KFH67919.1 hypothetical protein MVEG_06650 [Podila verticillata NRRL 6337]